MKLSPEVKEVIAKKLGLTIEEISNMSAENLDQHISHKILHKPLQIGKAGARLVPGRGSVFQTVSKKCLDQRIEALIGG